MRAFAYPKGGQINEHGLLELVEFSVSANPETIRVLAKFMLAAADKMESMGNRFGHLHAQDEIESWKDHWPDLVICGEVTNES
ncbi:hypothetical protein [Roseateles saccharophilus]|uniref:Uncharacterized protein n=1 Tax=Roseateles saccharophilus TaxID=304 RepID=A0A4R3UKD2_ROSSA|nr:hypothetical protein [Roseateles saccharophilus]MDG0835905.1 hypothetical protein [Roseateles saccharophilus]TCU89683.1 hypothetical protein EV671_103414 [Roseateles saccharophilus]